MHRSAILGLSAVAVAVAIASALGGCVIVIGNEDDFDDGYHAEWDVEFGDEEHERGTSTASGALLSDVRERFNNDADLRSEPILIAAKDGVVTLSGEVSNPRTLDRALQLAAQTPGVDSVVLKVVVAVDRGAGR